jgi:hypothetical protein
MAISEPTNSQRAEWAKRALFVFTRETYSSDHPDTMEPGDLESAIGDLIIDLLHLAVLKSMDVRTIYEHARDMFEQEIAEVGSCDCKERSWYGTYHDSQCPLRIAADAHQNATGGSNV